MSLGVENPGCQVGHKTGISQSHMQKEMVQVLFHGAGEAAKKFSIH
jgi:hypothetical protein